MKLAHVCDAQSGYTAKKRLELAETGGVPAIQLRDVSGLERFDPEDAALYSLGASFERYWAAPGDVLFLSRGERNTAVYVASETKTAAVAVLPLIILRPQRDLIDGEYLAWFINQPDAQRYFDKWARGTRLRMIPKGRLDDLEVPVPDLETQKAIVEIDKLAKREYALSRELAEKKKKATSFVLLEQARKSPASLQ